AASWLLSRGTSPSFLMMLSASRPLSQLSESGERSSWLKWNNSRARPMLAGERWYERCRGSLVGGALCLMLLVSCTTPVPPPVPKPSMFLVIPDPEGKVGQITVTNQTGSQVLDKPRQASTVQSANDAPSPPATLQETEIKQIFGEALAAQPTAPA